MKVPKRVQYGVILMVSIGMYANEGKYISILEISNMHHLPAKVLENVVMNLRFNNLVVGRRGCKNGGYRLAKSPQSITLADIIQALDDSMLGNRNIVCKHDSVEISIDRGFWRVVTQSISTIADSITLETIIESIKA